MFEDEFHYCRIDLNDRVSQTLITAIEKFITFIEEAPVPRLPTTPFTAPPGLGGSRSFNSPGLVPPRAGGGVPKRKVLVHCK